MKFYKKIISLILVITIISTTCVGFSSCSKSGPNNAGVTISDYLIKIVNEFGLDLDNTEITKDSSIKTAIEWEIIDDDNIDTTKNVTKGFVLVTLVKAVGFHDVSSLSDKEIAEYAVKNNYNAFKYKNSKSFNDYPNKYEVEQSIQNAKNIWTNPSFESKTDVEYSADVADLSNLSYNKKETSEIESNGFSDTSDFISNSNRKMVVIDGNADIKAGQTYVSPTIGYNAANEMYIAEKVEYKDGKTYITNSEDEIDIEESFENATFSGSNVVDDLTTVPIVDGDGIIHYPSTSQKNLSNSNDYSISNMSSLEEVSPSYLGSSKDNITTMNTGDREFSIKLSDDLEATITVGKDSVKCKASGTIKSKESPKEVLSGKITVDQTLEVKDISCDYNVNVLSKSAYVAVTGTQVQQLGISAKAEGNAYKITKSDISGLPNNKKSTVSKTLVEIPIVSSGPISICVVLKAKLSISGSIEFVLTTQSTYGAEVKKGKLRVIKDVKRERDLTINANIEGTAYIGPAVYLGKLNVISCGIEGGLGAEYKMTIHVVDIGLNQELYYQNVDNNVLEMGMTESLEAGIKADICQDVNVYWILKFTTDDDSFIFDALGISYSKEFFGKDNASFVDKHYEDGKEVSECTREYTGKETIIEEEKENYDNSIVLSSFSLSTHVGDDVSISVSKVPEGYDSSELIYESSDNSIAVVSSTGVVTGKESGSAIITVYTKDKKFSTKCAVTILKKTMISFDFDMKNEGYSI